MITGEGKFFSNGLDLDYLASHKDEVEPFMLQYVLLMIGAGDCS